MALPYLRLLAVGCAILLGCKGADPKHTPRDATEQVSTDATRDLLSSAPTAGARWTLAYATLVTIAEKNPDCATMATALSEHLNLNLSSLDTLAHDLVSHPSSPEEREALLLATSNLSRATRDCDEAAAEVLRLGVLYANALHHP